MPGKNKFGQGTEGRRVRQISSAATFILKVFDPSDNATAVDASGPMVVDEMEMIGIQFFAGGTLAGSWLVEVSNDFSVGQYGFTANAGRWKDITSLVSPTLAAVVDGTAATETQYGQLQNFGGGAIRISFTATAGTGLAEAWTKAKGA